MASILIFHAPNDLDAASELGGQLEALGHAVLYDGDPELLDHEKLTGLGLFDCVIIIWSADLINSEEHRAVALKALHMNKFISIRTADLSVEQIDPDFRELNTFLVDDVEGILDTLRHLDPVAFSTRKSDDDMIGSSTTYNPDIGSAESSPRPQEFGSSPRHSPLALPGGGKLRRRPDWRRAARPHRNERWNRRGATSLITRGGTRCSGRQARS